MYNIYEVTNMTFDSTIADNYLVIKQGIKPKKFKFPVTMGELSKVLMSKKRSMLGLNNIIPYVDLTEDEYNELLNYNELSERVLYRIIDPETGDIVKLFLNFKEYGANAGVAFLAGYGAAFLSSDGAIYSDVVGTGNLLIDVTPPQSLIGTMTDYTPDTEIVPEGMVGDDVEFTPDAELTPNGFVGSATKVDTEDETDTTDDNT